LRETIWYLKMATNLQDPDFHFNRILGKWQEAVQSIFETAEYVRSAKHELGEYQYQQLWERDDAPFSLKTADKLIAISQNNLLTKIKEKLPPYWTTIYYISTQSDYDIQRAVDAEIINPEANQKEIELFLRGVGSSTSSNQASQTTTQSTTRYAGLVVDNSTFDPDRLDEFENELKVLISKYSGVSLETDTSKSGIRRLRAQKRVDEINAWIDRRLETHNKVAWGIKEEKLFHSAAGQIFDTGVTIPDPGTGELHITDIHHPENPYHGWNKRDFYDFARENMIVTDWCKIEEIDKELFIQTLLAQYLNPDASAAERSDAKKKLERRASKVGNVQSRASAQAALNEIETFKVNK